MRSILFEVKKGRKWQKVRATSFSAINEWCKQNGFSDWRMVGMMSNDEIAESKTLQIVA